MTALKSPQAPFWSTPQGYAASHCLNCTGAWVRRKGEFVHMVCMLDREPVLADMTDCDHFERKAEEPVQNPSP